VSLELARHWHLTIYSAISTEVSKVEFLSVARSSTTHLHYSIIFTCLQEIAPHLELYIHKGFACRRCELYIDLKLRTDNLHDKVFLQTRHAGTGQCK
jgi:hypothetical protein